MSGYAYENTFDGNLTAKQVKKAVWDDVYNSQEQPWLLRETGIPASESANEAIGGMYIVEEQIFENETTGADYCYAHRNDYIRAGIAFKAYVAEPAEPTKTNLALADRIKREEEKLAMYEASHNAKNRKSAYVGCKGCGSSINKNFVGDKNVCPVCGASLFSPTDTETIARYKVNIKRWKKDYEAALQKHAKKKVVWFVSTSYH